MAVQSHRKRSKQRDAIIAFLKTRKDHPTADTVYKEIRHTIPNISLGTVYRNLSLLSENGEILKLSCDGKADRFDAFSNPHYHFMCVECGCVQDIPFPYSEELDLAANSEFDGTITGHSLLFKGYCKNCCGNQVHTACESD